MKVIVCFDEVRVTVPCGDGEIPVSELITKAVHRYKRATGKGDASVTVTSLKTISGGGILDPDDQLNDVVDDREQLIAEFDEPGRVARSVPLSHPYHLHNGGDGGTASSCSTGAVSPDMFQSGDAATNDTTITIPPFVPARRRHHHNSSSSASSSTNTNTAATDVVVTPRDLSIGSNLRVRRGSDPGLNILDTLVKEASVNKPTVPARPSITRRESVRESDDPKSESSEDEKRMKMAAYGSLDRKRFSHKFNRDMTRASLSNRPEMARWIEAQERRMEKTKTELSPDGIDGNQHEAKGSLPESPIQVTIPNDGGPLGIHAVPAYDQDSHASGLLIQSVEPGRPVDRDGRISPNDVVIEINGINLYDVPFLQAQDIFRSAMQSKEIHLTVVKGQPTMSPSSPTSPEDSNTLPYSSSSSKPKRQAPPPPVMPKPRNHIPNKPSPLTLPHPQSPTDSNQTGSDRVRSDADEDSTSQFPRQQQKQQDSSQSANPHIHHHPRHHHSTQNSSSSSCSSIQNNGDIRVPSMSTFSKQPPSEMTAISAGTNSVIKPGPPIRPPKKVPVPTVPNRNPKTVLTSQSPEAPININALTNTRRIGKRIDIQLKKGPLGLGFSVTSRDNQTDGDCPIYIRNILPKGAAIQDGNLKIGDRLLEVDGVGMTGKNQAEAVALLRMLPEGSLVDLVVSRQEEVDERFKMPRQLETTNGKTPVEPANVVVNSEKSLEDVGVEEAIDLDDDNLSHPQPTSGVNNLDSPPGFTKEKITLRIPLNDTGSAGLGVSVKGKTQTKDSGVVQDLGIFVKTVMQGGAASKDGRLLVNDQLLEVNGISLGGLANTTAMEALRSAMMEDGHNPGGYITLSVARYSGGAVSPSLFQFGDSPNTSLTGSDLLDGAYSKFSGSVNSFVHQRSSSTNESSSQRSASPDSKDMPSPIPPVRSKRVGQLRDKFNELSNAIRNESYAKATHESLNDSSAFTNIMPSSPMNPSEPMRANSPAALEDDKDVYAVSSKMQRPHSTIGFLHGPKSQSSLSDDEAFRRTSTASSKDDSDLSPVGDLILPFAREGFGRQSMSEKRKGHIDPRSTEVYKQAKANKENKGTPGAQSAKNSSGSKTVSPRLKRNSSAEGTSPPKAPQSSNLHDSTYHPPNQPSESGEFGLKRASSVEDLSKPKYPSETSINPSQPNNTNPQQARETSPAWRTNRFGRARACNDSFRAAVDRSYDILDPNLMDTLEEESLESNAFNQDPSFSGRSSISSENTQEDTNSLKRQKGKDKDKKASGGLLKGFLRFGKGRKSNEEAIRRSRSEERSAHKNNNNHQVSRKGEHSMDRAANLRSRNQWDEEDEEHGFYPVDSNQSQHQTSASRRRASQQESERIEEQYARLREHHVTEQRLRSQSVDPSAGRAVESGVVIYPDRASPFQPYVASGSNYHHHPIHHQQQRHPSDRSNTQDNQDPRLVHPAAMAQGPIESGHGYRGQGSNQSHRHNSHDSSTSDSRSNITKAVLSRAEKIQQLRTMYQQKHKQNQGVYPLDDTEEKYEQQIQKLERKWSSGPSRFPPETDSRHDTDSPIFYDRNPQEQSGHPMVRPYNSSSNMNINSSMATSNTAAHYNHQLQYTNSNSSSSNSSSHRQPRSRPHSRGASTGTFPGAGVGGGGGNQPYYQHDSNTLDSQYYQQQQHQQQHQSSYYPQQHQQRQHHTLPHSHSYVNSSSQEEITSFSGFDHDYDMDNNHRNQHQHHHGNRSQGHGYTNYHDKESDFTRPPNPHQYSSSPSQNYLSSSLPYSLYNHHNHNHHHHSTSTNPDSAKV